MVATKVAKSNEAPLNDEGNSVALEFQYNTVVTIKVLKIQSSREKKSYRLNTFIIGFVCYNTLHKYVKL